jgi:hypothetical protein
MALTSKSTKEILQICLKGERAKVFLFVISIYIV